MRQFLYTIGLAADLSIPTDKKKPMTVTATHYIIKRENAAARFLDNTKEREKSREQRITCKTKH